MGIHRSFYIEGLVDGKWKCVCPRYKRKDGTFGFHEIIEGKSFLQDICDDFCDTPVVVGEDLKNTSGYSNGNFYSLNMEKAQRFVFSRFNENEGYVEKRVLKDFQFNACKFGSDYGIHEWLSVDEFRALDKDSQKAYVYFEWTNRYDSLNILKGIFVIAEKFKELYENELYALSDSNNPTDYRIIVGIG